MKLVLAFMFSLLLAWGKCERTACSTSRRLPWEGRPNPGKPPLVTPSEGSTTREAQGGKQTEASISDNSNSSLPSIVTGRNYELSSGRASEGVFKSETQIETQNPKILTTDTLR